MRLSLLQNSNNREMRYNPYVNSQKKPSPEILKDSNTVAWWDFTDVSKVVKDSNNFVSSVLDISGLGNTLNQTIQSLKPIWDAEGVLFDGIDDSLKVILNIPQPYSIYIRLKNYKFYNYNAGILATDSMSWYYFPNNQDRAYQFAGSANGANVLFGLNTFNAGAMIYDGANSESMGLSPFQPVSNTGTAGINGTLVIGNAPAGSNATNIKISHLIIRKIHDTKQNQTDIYNYLNGLK